MRRCKHARVGLIEDDNLMTAGRKRDLLLRKLLDLVAYDIDSAVRGWGFRLVGNAMERQGSG